jgi:hypothetical protein
MKETKLAGILACISPAHRTLACRPKSERQRKRGKHRYRWEDENKVGPKENRV